MKRRFSTIGLASVLAGVALAGAACDKGEEPEQAVEDLTIVVEADKSRILEEEKALGEQREKFESERIRLATEKADIQQKLASLSKKDKKQRDKLESEQSRLEEEEKRIRTRTQNFEGERSKLERQKNELLERISTMTARKGGMSIEERESQMAGREKDVARREEAVAKREAALTSRESEATKNLQELGTILADLRGGGGVTRTVIVNAPAGGAAAAPASRTQAQKSQKQLRQKMDAKGILMDDLPPTAKSLHQQALDGLNRKEYGDSVAAFTQVEEIVDGIAINQSFVSGKMQRLNRAITTQQLDDKKREKLQGLLAEVSDAAADGRYDRANKKANQIALVLNGGE